MLANRPRLLRLRKRVQSACSRPDLSSSFALRLQRTHGNGNLAGLLTRRRVLHDSSTSKGDLCLPYLQNAADNTRNGQTTGSHGLLAAGLRATSPVKTKIGSTLRNRQFFGTAQSADRPGSRIRILKTLCRSPSCSIDRHRPLPQYLLPAGAKWYNWPIMESQALRAAPEPERQLRIKNPGINLPGDGARQHACPTRTVGNQPSKFRIGRWKQSGWQLAKNAEAGQLPTVLGIIGKIDRIRAGMVDEALRVAEIIRAVPSPG